MFDLIELEALLPNQPSPEYQEQLARINAYWARIKKQVPSELLEPLFDEYTHLHSIDAREQFLSGLYLGANLILALSQPPARTPRP